MSKILTIVRHGKSDWSYDDLADFDRPLKARGYTDAYKMAERLKKEEPLPDLFYTSPANRALYTAIIFARVLFNQFDNIDVNEDLYMASYRSILNILRQSPDKSNHIAIFGHNPGVTDFANKFIFNQIDNIPTAGYVKFEFDTNCWKDVNPENLTNHSFEYPKKSDTNLY
jgi:phosphohistidine phosphatase